MTYSQINHAKAWGFSRRTPNLNLFLCSKGRLSAKGIRGVPLNEQPSTRNSYITSSGDEWEINNLQTLCPECNKIKTAEDAGKIAKLRDIEKKQSNGQTLLPLAVKIEGGECDSSQS